MSASGDTRQQRDQYPTFELACRFDDVDQPGEVTVYLDENGSRSTAWLTMDVEHVVPLDRVV